MDIKIKGVRKRCRVLWEVKPMNGSWPRFYFWRTGRYRITRETMMEAGLDVARYGAVTSQLSFRRIRKTKT